MMEKLRLGNVETKVYYHVLCWEMCDEAGWGSGMSIWKNSCKKRQTDVDELMMIARREFGKRVEQVGVLLGKEDEMPEKMCS